MGTFWASGGVVGKNSSPDELGFSESVASLNVNLLLVYAWKVVEAVRIYTSDPRHTINLVLEVVNAAPGCVDLVSSQLHVLELHGAAPTSPFTSQKRSRS